MAIFWLILGFFLKFCFNNFFYQELQICNNLPCFSIMLAFLFISRYDIDFKLIIYFMYFVIIVFSSTIPFKISPSIPPRIKICLFHLFCLFFPWYFFTVLLRNSVKRRIVLSTIHVDLVPYKIIILYYHVIQNLLNIFFEWPIQ